jgi:hypothetical protein
MKKRKLADRDLYGGAIFVVLGIVVLFQGVSYNIGSLAKVGPGLFPVALGVVLTALGVLIVLNGMISSKATDAEASPMQWRGIVAIVLGVVGFIAFGYLFGLAPAAFICVFVSAWGDREATFISTLILATVVTLFALLFFSYFLSIQFPILQSPWGPP